MSQMTKAQQTILESIRTNGGSVTVKTLQRALGYGSPQAIWYHLRKLIGAGHITATGGFNDARLELIDTTPAPIVGDGYTIRPVANSRYQLEVDGQPHGLFRSINGAHRHGQEVRKNLEWRRTPEGQAILAKHGVQP